MSYFLESKEMYFFFALWYLVGPHSMQTGIDSGPCKDLDDNKFTVSHICASAESYVGPYGVLPKVYKGICIDNSTNGEVAEEIYQVRMDRGLLEQSGCIE